MARMTAIEMWMDARKKGQTALAALIRDNFVPSWYAAPDRDGWYWCEALGPDSPPQKIARHSRGTDSEGADVQPLWKRWTVAGWVDVEGRVSPITDRPEEVSPCV